MYPAPPVSIQLMTCSLPTLVTAALVVAVRVRRGLTVTVGTVSSGETRRLSPVRSDGGCPERAKAVTKRELRSAGVARRQHVEQLGGDDAPGVVPLARG